MKLAIHPMVALVKYLSWANAMRAHFEIVVPKAQGRMLGDVNVSLALMFVATGFPRSMS